MTTFKRVKHGQYFILYGAFGKVAFILDDTKKERTPTRLHDGCYYSLPSDSIVEIVTPEAAKKQVLEYRRFEA